MMIGRQEDTEEGKMKKIYRVFVFTFTLFFLSAISFTGLIGIVGVRREGDGIIILLSTGNVTWGCINPHRKQLAYGDVTGSVENLDANDFVASTDIEHDAIQYSLVDNFLLALIQADIKQIYF